MTPTLPPHERARRLPAAGPGLWRAPTQAARSPGSAAALAAAVALLVLAAAVRPLFVDSVGDAALDEALDQYRPETLGVTVSLLGGLDVDALRGADSALRAYADGTVLGEASVEVRPQERGAVLHPADGEPIEVQYPIGFPVGAFQLYGRTGATAHLPEPEGAGAGVWVPRRVAAAAGVGPGDELGLEMRGQVVDLPVAGTYRDLVEVVPTSVYTPPDALPAGHPVTEFWAPRADLVAALTGDGTAAPAPPLLIGEPDVIAALGGERFRPPTRTAFTFPLPRAVATVREVDGTLAAYADLEAAALGREEPLHEALRAAADIPGGHVHVSSLLEQVAVQPRALTATLDASLAPATFGAQALALTAMLGLGLALARRRRAEHAFLGAQGLGAAWVAGRATAEAVLPALAGGLCGAAVAIGLTRLLGPGGAPGGAVLREVAVTAFLGALAGVALWGFAAVTARPRLGGGPGSGRVGHLVRRAPWELLLVAGAVAAGVALAGREGGLLVGEGETRHLDVLAVAFPALLVGATAGTAARLLGGAGAWLRGRGGSVPTALWLSARGIAAAPGSARAALAATTVGVGLLTFGVVAAGSVDETVEAKAAAAGGGQTAVTFPPRAELPALGVAHTEVLRTTGTAYPAGHDVDVLAIDPPTFAAAAAWRDVFADEPLERLLAGLRGTDTDGLPVLAVGFRPAEVERLTTDRYELPVTVVAVPRAFPGMAGARRLLVVDRERLVRAAAATDPGIDELFVLRRRREIWIAGDRTLAQPLEGGFHLGQQSARGVDEVRDRPDLRAAVWTLDYLRAVGVVAGGLALVALLGYAVGRHRRRAAALALARRMGLSARGARLALAAELGGLGLAGAVPGALAGVGAASAVVALLDPLPDAPPEPFLAVPTATLVLAVLAVPVLAAVGGLATARTCATAPAGALLRDG